MKALDRVNRTVVSIIGLVLLAIGGYGLLRGAGLFGDDRAEDPLLLRSVQDFVADTEPWFWAAVAVISLLIALAAARWFAEQVTPSPSLSTLNVASREGSGRSTLETSAVGAAVARDIEADPDVADARVRVVPKGSNIGLDVRASVVDTGDVHAVRQRIETVVLERARTALGRPDLTADVRLRLGDPGARSVF